MKCKCKKDLVWEGDYPFEDYGLEGGGILSKYHCYNSDCLHNIVLDYEPVLVYFWQYRIQPIK